MQHKPDEVSVVEVVVGSAAIWQELVVDRPGFVAVLLLAVWWAWVGLVW